MDHQQSWPSDAQSSFGENPLGIWDAGCDDDEIPPRGWLLGTVFCRRFLSSVIADGGVGKTALRIAQLLSLAVGRSLTGEHVHMRCRVLIVSLEDDRDELRRRVRAAMLHYNIEPKTVEGWLYLCVPKGMRLAEMQNGIPMVREFEAMIRQAITELSIDVTSIDPFIKSHGMEENSNNAIDFVCTLLSKIAIELDTAIDLPHHKRKASTGPGDADGGRGASSMKDAARLVYTLSPMSPDEANSLAVDEADRRSLVRFDSGKVNIAPQAIDALWFKIVGVPLGNATEAYPAGDNVQTVERWFPQTAWAGIDMLTIGRILNEIDAGRPDGQRYSAAPAAGQEKAAWRVVVRHLPDKPEKQARSIIKTWLANGVLFEEEYDDPVVRKPRTGLRVDPIKRPT